MPFIDKSTLTYPATNSFPVRKWLDSSRGPTSSDFRNFEIFDIWIWTNMGAWIMIDKTPTFGTWTKMGASSVGISSINSVPPDGGGNITIAGSSPITVTNDAAHNTVTIGLSGTVATSFPTDAGTAIPAVGALTIHGGMGITTSGAGSTVTINAAASVPLTFDTDGAPATPAGNAITIHGGTGIVTSGAGSTVTITAAASTPLTFTANAGSATPAGNNLNILGAGGATTSGAGSTITVTTTGGGITWNNITVVGPTTMAVNNGYTADDAAAQVQLLLPIAAAYGSIIRVVGTQAMGWIIQQNAGQIIVNGAATTTLGDTGTLASSSGFETVELLCIVTNTTFQVIDGNGNYILT